jgi:hypothetical protein
VEQPPFAAQAIVEPGAGIRREDVEGGGLDAAGDRPVDRPGERRGVVAVHAEDEAAVHHDALRVQPADGGAVVPVQVLQFAVGAQVLGAERLEADEEAAQPGRGGFLEQPRAQPPPKRRRPPECRSPGRR